MIYYPLHQILYITLLNSCFLPQIEYGRIVACFAMSDTNEHFVVIHKFVKTGHRNEQECELFKQLPQIIITHPQNIIKSISIIPECTRKCKHMSTATYLIEREQIENKRKLTLLHDYAESLFCLNVYAMHK